MFQAKERELRTLNQFKVYSPVLMGTQTKGAAWKEADGEKAVQARLEAKGGQDSDFRDGSRYRGMREPWAPTLAIDIPGDPEGMGDLESGHQGWISPSGWFWP